MNIIMSGEATPSQIGAFLMGMRVKGETVGEIAAAVSILREKMVPVEAPEGAIDIVGTGGDGAGTLNISTATAIVVASAGVPVAKHGNRALSSKSGAVRSACRRSASRSTSTPEQISRCISEAGIGFMFAPAHHPAMKHVGPARAGTRHANDVQPARPAIQSGRRPPLHARRLCRRWVEPVAAALLANRAIYGLGRPRQRRARRTHRPPARRFVASIKGGSLTSFEVTPEDAGLPRASPRTSRAATRRTMPAALRALLDGARTPYRDIVLLNAAAALIVAGRADTLKLGADLAAARSTAAAAKATLDKLIAVSNA